MFVVPAVPWWLVDHQTVPKTYDQSQRIPWVTHIFYDARWRLHHLCWKLEDIELSNHCGVPFIIFFYLDDLFPTEAQKDWAQ